MSAARKRPLGWMALAAILCAGSAAADVTPADRTAARALFDQARKLVNEGKHAEACPKFEESQRLDPGIGTLFNLADCLEATGKTASAWSLFLEAASQAKVGGQKDREKVARNRALALEPKLSKLTISVATQVPGLEVKRDGTLLREAMWGTPVAIDPGDHVVEATAPAKKKYTAIVKVGGPSATATVMIPTLEPEGSAPVAAPVTTTPPPVASPQPAPAPAAATPEPEAVTAQPVSAPTPQPEPPPSDKPAEQGSTGGTQRVLGLVSGGLGVVAIGVSGFLTLGAKGKLNDAEQWCSGNQCTDQQGVDLHSDAVKQANLATIVGGVGGVLLVGGAVLYFTASSKSPSKAARVRAPVIGLGPTGLMVKGAW